MQLSMTSFRDMVTMLNEIETWLNKNKNITTGSRFERIKESVQKLADEHDKYTSGKPFDFNSLGDDVENFTYEAEPFLQVYKHLKNETHVKFDGLLSTVVNGPDYSEDEDNGSNVHRNHMFELLLAAKLVEVGMTIKDYEDVVFDFEGYEIAIQCKRPMGPNSFNRVIHEAYDQFFRHNDMATNDKVRGIIAFSVDKLLNLDKTITKFNVDQEIDIEVYNMTKCIVNLFRNTWQDLKHKKVIGLFLFYRFPVEILSRNLLTSVGYLSAIPFVDPDKQEDDYDLFMKLGKILQ